MNIKLEIKKYQTWLIITKFLNLAIIVMETFTSDFLETVLINGIIIILSTLIIFISVKFDKIKEIAWLNENGNNLKCADWDSKPLADNFSKICYMVIIAIAFVKIALKAFVIF